MAGGFSPEFRRRAVELARERIKSVPELAADFGGFGVESVAVDGAGRCR